MRSHLAVLVVLVACGPAVPAESAGGGSSAGETTSASTSAASGTANPDPSSPASTASTTSSDPATTSIPSTSTTDPGSSDSGVDFIARSDTPPHYECDLYDQACERGMKCTLVSDPIGGSSIWGNTACVPVEPDPVGLGESCQMQFEDGRFTGHDDCPLGSICWDFSDDGVPGVCKGFCEGSDSDPSCEDSTATPAVLCQECGCLCEYSCNPLADECLEGYTCSLLGYLPTCIPLVPEPVGVGEACEYVNDCDSGLLCVYTDSVPDCDGGSGCCTPYCDVSDPQCPEGTQCVPYFRDGGGPPELQGVGACVIPE